MNNSFERIYRIWSEGTEDHLSVRIQFSVDESGSCRVFQLGRREQWN